MESPNQQFQPGDDCSDGNQQISTSNLSKASLSSLLTGMTIRNHHLGSPRLESATLLSVLTHLVAELGPKWATLLHEFALQICLAQLTQWVKIVRVFVGFTIETLRVPDCLVMSRAMLCRSSMRRQAVALFPINPEAHLLSRKMPMVILFLCVILMARQSAQNNLFNAHSLVNGVGIVRWS